MRAAAARRAARPAKTARPAFHATPTPDIRRALATAVPYAELKAELLPEGSAFLQRELALVEGPPKALERTVGNRLVEALERAAAEPRAETLASDEDFECPECGFVTFASKSFRLSCAKCGAPREPLPARDAYLLTGARGSGKSVCLATVVSWARRRDWLALYVPRAWDLAHAGAYVVPSQHRAGKFEEPRGSRAILEAFRAAHGPQAARVAVADGEVGERWGASTLAGVLDAALDDKRVDEASTGLADVLGVLRAQTELPALVAVDEYTALVGRAEAFWDNKRLACGDLVHLEALAALGPAGVPEDKRIARGAYVLADSLARGPPGLDAREKRLRVAHPPFELPMGRYDDSEFVAAVHRYASAGFLGVDLSAADLDELKVATQRNPELLFKRLMMM